MVRDLQVYQRNIEALATDDLDPVERWVLHTAVVVHRSVRNEDWDRFASTVYRPPRWPRAGSVTTTHALIIEGVELGIMKTADPELAYHLIHHLHLGFTGRLKEGGDMTVRDALSHILTPAFAVLGLQMSKVPDVVDWVAPLLESVDWTVDDR